MSARTMACRLLAGPPCLVLLGGCAGSSTPSTPAPSAASPSTTTAPSAPPAAAVTYGPVTVVAGTNDCPGLDPSWTEGPGDTRHVRDQAVACTDTTDDPRVSGSHIARWNMNLWGDPGAGAAAGVQWGTVRLENDGGAWEGRLSGVYSSDRGDIIAIWYRGTGGYAGLSYFELLTGRGPWTIQGQISPGDPPDPEGFPPLTGTTFTVTAPANRALPTPVAYGPVTSVEGTASQAPSGNMPVLVSTGAGGVQHWRASDSHWVEALNDPRVSGALVTDLNVDIWGMPDHGAAIQWGRARITNAEGAWDGASTGTVDPEHGDTFVGWLTGSGAHAGLTYFYLGTNFPPNKLQGLVYPGTPPQP